MREVSDFLVVYSRLTTERTVHARSSGSSLKGVSVSTRINVTIDEKLEAYLDTFASREPAALRECRDEANARGEMAVMQIAPEQGAFFGLLVEMIGAKQVLELGTFTGYSTAAFALHLPEDGSVTTCDITDEYINIAEELWQKSGVSHKIHFVQEDAVSLLERLAGTNKEHFDIVFIDADKPNYVAYYEGALPLVRPGGLILVDDSLARGFVANAPDPQYGKYIIDSIEAIQQLNQRIHEDNRVHMALIPAWDGLTIVRKR